jgi:LPS-assembly protein
MVKLLLRGFHSWLKTFNGKDMAQRLILRARLNISASLWPLILAASFCCAPVQAESKNQTQTFLTMEPNAPDRGLPEATETIDVAATADGLGPDTMFIQAEHIDIQNQTTVIAHGNVEIRYQGRLIRADKVTYQRDKGHVLAEGHAVSLNPDGSAQYADSLDFYDNKSRQAQITTGIGRKIASTFPDNTKIFAAKMQRVSERITVISKALYTPCVLCVKNGKMKPPVWSISAEKIIQDKQRNLVFYRNGFIMIRNVPLLYFPVLWHPDPSLKRSSGLLIPSIDFSQKRGTTYVQPYYWSISPYSGLLVEPWFNSKVNPFLNLTYQRAFYSGDFKLRFGYSREKYFDSTGRKWTEDATGKSLPGNGEATDHSYIISNGDFRINPNWRWSFTAERVFDDKAADLFDRYKVKKAFQSNGYFTAPPRQLISQLNFVRQTHNSFIALTTLNFQSLKIGALQRLNSSGTLFRPIAQASENQPLVAPMLEVHLTPETKFLGGRVQLDISGVALFRSKFPRISEGYNPAYAPAVSDQVSGFDSKRLTGEVSWQRSITTRQGLRLNPFVKLRHDSYQINDITSLGLKRMVNRNLSTLGFDVSYPLIRPLRGYSLEVTPQAQLALSPRVKTNDFIPNEDSQVFSFDSTNLFKADKSPGFDLYEGGQRLSLGLSSRLRFDNGAKIEALAGRVFRNEVERIYLRRIAANPKLSYDPTGLASVTSDWIVDTNFDSGRDIRGYTRMRFDQDLAVIRRGEAGLTIIKPTTLATLRYIVDRSGATLDASGTNLKSTNAPVYENTSFYARHFISKTYGASVRVNYDNLKKQYSQSEISLIYRDDCTWLELVYLRDATLINQSGGRRGVDSLSLRLNLITFGSTGTDFTGIR